MADRTPAAGPRRAVLPEACLRAARLLALVLIPALAPSAPAADWGLTQLMQGLAQRGAERATFTEKKYIAILDQPLESSGELRYVPPDRLEKRTLKPRQETVVLERDTLVVERGNQKHTLRMQDYPEVAAFIESIRGTLSGDRRALERVYRLELHGDAERWTLVLLPSDAKLATLVLRIDVAGSRERVRRIEVLQADGDRSVMTIEPVAGAPRAAPAAAAPRPAPK